MNCMCGTELIHGGDHDAEPPWLIVSNLCCPECGRHVLVYEPDQEDPEWSL